MLRGSVALPYSAQVEQSVCPVRESIDSQTLSLTISRHDLKIGLPVMVFGVGSPNS